MIINEIINRMTGNSNKEDHKDFSEEVVQRIIIDERNKYVSDYENGIIRHLNSEDFQERIIKRLKKSGIDGTIYEPPKEIIKEDRIKKFRDDKKYSIVVIVCKKDGKERTDECTITLIENFKEIENLYKKTNTSKRIKKALTTVALIGGIIGAGKLFGNEIGNIIDFNSFGIEKDDNTFSFNNNKEKEYIYDMIYRLEEKQPVDENGNPTVYRAEVNNDYAHYEVCNPGHLTGKGLKQGDLRDMTQEQVETLHSTAAGTKRAENIGRDFQSGVSTNGMFDFGRDSNGEVDESKLPRYVAYESLFEMVKHNGTEIVAYGGGKECVENPSDDVLKMLIDFTAMTNALTNTTKSVCHGDVSKQQSRLKDGPVIRYADEHYDPTILMDNPNLKEEVINEISKRTEYYKSIGVNPDDYIKYARSRKTKETQSKISSDDEAVYSNLSEQEKQNIAKAYQYFKDECDMDIDEIGVSGIVGVILATSKGNPTHTGNNGTYGILPVNKTNLQNWAEQKGKNFEDIETQLEYYSKVVLKNTSYRLGTDRNDYIEYYYPVNYGNLGFICAGDAANWTLLYALHLDSSDYAKKMAELIYEHRKDLEGIRLTFLRTDDLEYKKNTSNIDWKGRIKIDIDEPKAIVYLNEKDKTNNADFEIVI